MRILNLGCGTKTSPHPDVLNIDWALYIRLKKMPVVREVLGKTLPAEMARKFAAIPPNILPHNLRKGIPFEDGSVDAVYHSHVLEHIDREYAEGFVREIHRVLKPGGILRIAVPDMERYVRAYLAHLELCLASPEHADDHDDYMAPMLEQSVRRDAAITWGRPPFRRYWTNVIFGDARRRGETHQWMYDRVNLRALLVRTGFREPTLREYDESAIPNWNEYGLDADLNGSQYKPESLYMEAVK